MAVTQDPRFGIDVWGAGTDPFPGREGWDELLGLLTSKAAITSQGVASAMGAAGIAGRFFWATDSRRLWRDDGAAWTEISPVGGGGPGAGPTTFTTALQPGGEGAARMAARADHTHPLPATPIGGGGAGAGPATFTTALQPGSEGVSTKGARADHKHPLPAQFGNRMWSWPRGMGNLVDNFGVGGGNFVGICGGTAAGAAAGLYLAGFHVNLRTVSTDPDAAVATHLRFEINGVNLSGDARQDLLPSFQMICWQQPLIIGAGNIGVQLYLDASIGAASIGNGGSGAYLIYLGPPG